MWVRNVARVRFLVRSFKGSALTGPMTERSDANARIGAARSPLVRSPFFRFASHRAANFAPISRKVSGARVKWMRRCFIARGSIVESSDERERNETSYRADATVHVQMDKLESS